jgi:hypothetical protein
MPIGRRFANDGLSDEATQQGNRIVASEKDPLGQKLHDVEGARVDQWARQHDAELLEQIHNKWTSALQSLKGGKTRRGQIFGKRQAFACPEGHGAWIDRATLDSITKS